MICNAILLFLKIDGIITAMITLRFFHVCFFVLLGSTFLCRAADDAVPATPAATLPENRFEAFFADGETQTGNIIAMDSEKLLLSEDGKTQTIPLERLEALQNSSENPFQMVLSNRQSPDMPYPPTMQRNQRQRNQRIRPIIPLLNANKAVAESKPKISYPASVIVLTLRDGSRLIAEKITMKGQTVQCTPLSLSNDKKNAAEVQFSVQQLASVRFDVKSLELVYTPPEQWTKIADAKDRKADKLVFGQNDTLDFYEGAITEITADKVMFASDGETLPVPIRRITGLILFNNTEENNSRTPKGDGEPILAHLSLWNGTEIALKTISFRDNEFFDWTSASGISGSVSGSEIDRFEFGLDNFWFVSDLEPMSVQHQFPFNWKTGGENSTFINLQRTFFDSRFRQPDETEQANVLAALTVLPVNDARLKNISNPLPGLEGVQLDGTVYQNGLSIPTGTVLEYKITENFASLRGSAGIDDRLRPQGNVRFVVQANETLLCDWIIKGYEPAKQIRFDLPQGTKTLRISVQDISGIANPFAVGVGNLKLVK